MNRSPIGPALGLQALVLSLLSACTSGSIGTHTHDADGGATADAAPPLDAGTPPAADGGDPDAEGCASLDLAATPTMRPVDVILWVDDGGSFGGSRAKVVASMNELASILDAASVDYRIIVLGAYVSVAEPLHSSPRYFHAMGGYSAGGGGYAFFDTNLSAYRDWLRTDAFKVFLSATDCEHEAGTFEDFEMHITTNAPDQFTGGDGRNFIYHMIGNVAARTPSTDPWEPTDPVAGRGPYGSYTACVNVQHGAIVTGGLRLSVGATDYATLFEAIAALGVGESRLPCSFAVPPGELDLHRVRFRFQPGDGSMEQAYREVDSMGACTDVGGFYVDGMMVRLCPTTCDAVSMDAMGHEHFTFECGLH